MCLLLDAESDITHGNKWGQTLLNWTSYFQGDIRFIEKLLIQPGISLNGVDDQGMSAIENACFRSHVKVISYLLEHGADPNKAKQGSKPLFDCINLNHHAALNVLLRKSTNPPVDLAYQDPSGGTCLHALARAANLRTVSTFLRVLEDETITLDLAGLNTAHVGKNGLTARDLLRIRGDEGVRFVLERVLVIIDRENASEKSSVLTKARTLTLSNSCRTKRRDVSRNKPN